jgi:cytochrome b561
MSHPNPSSAEARDRAAHYDRTTIALHWATVVLLLVLWIMGQTTDWLPRGPFRSGVWAVHVVLGFLLGFVLLTRIAWRAHFGRVLPPADTGALHWIAKTTHTALYLLLAVVVVSGLINASYRGFDLFGMWSVPQFGTGDVDTRHGINEWHEVAANLLFAVALLHAGAALVHHYVWRDRLIDRMTP